MKYLSECISRNKWCHLVHLLPLKVDLLSVSSILTPRPRAALLMCLKKYSAIGNSAIGNYVVLCSKLILKTVLLEVSCGKYG